MGVVIQHDRHLEPRCLICSHTSSSHNYVECTYRTSIEFRPDSTIDWDARKRCTCTGWERDMNRPPPIIVQT